MTKEVSMRYSISNLYRRLVLHRLFRFNEQPSPGNSWEERYMKHSEEILRIRMHLASGLRLTDKRTYEGTSHKNFGEFLEEILGSKHGVSDLGQGNLANKSKALEKDTKLIAVIEDVIVSPTPEKVAEFT